MTSVVDTAVPTGQQGRLRRLRGWRLVLLLASPYLLIQFVHEVAPGLFPDFFSIVGEDQVVPFRDWANRSLLYLKNEDLLGLFNFKDLTRAVSGWLEYPLDVSEQLLIAGDGPFGLGAVPWVTLVAGFAVAGAWLGGWRLSVLVGGCSLYLAIFDVWDDSMITLSIVLVVAPLAAVIGWGLGLAAAKSKQFEAMLIPGLNVMQSMPHFSYLLPISVFIGIGDEAGAIATVLFAVPPMARLTLLGLQTVPTEVLEAGRMAGCTRRQMLWKVEMPAARPQLMVGVNQVLMQCFGMTVLASFVGTRGLGLPLLNYLQSLRVGRALEVGVAIVLMAIMLDRLSQAAGSRKPEHTDQSLSWLQRHPFLVAGSGVTVGGILLGQLFNQAKVLPEKWTVSTAPFWEEVVDWVQLNLKSPLGEFRDFMILEILIPMRNGFESLPWLGLLALVAMIGWYFGGWRLAAIVSSFVAYLAFSGFWIESMETLYLVVASLVVSVVVGVPVGVYASRTDHRYAAMQVLLDTFQVLPSFIYLIPVVMLFRVGPVAALVAIVIYSTVPAVRYTMLGLRNVPADVVEAARMAGCTEFQILRKVRMPMAFPEIMLGMNQVLLFSLLLVIIAAFIGGIEGLGDEILRSRTEQALVGEGLVAGFNVAVIGLTADQLIISYARDRKAQLGIA